MAQAGTPLTDYSRLTSIEDSWDLPPGSVTTWLIPDVPRANALFNFDSFALGPEPSLGNNRGVTEENTGVYLQVDFNTMLGDMPLRGNAGVRYIQTDQTSVGYQLVTGVPLLTTVERDYDDVLPSVNFVLEVTPDFLVRLGYSEVITRPGLGNLTPGGNVSVSGNNRTVTAGNPLLDPFEADAVDASFEWYFSDESLFGVALFYKDISTFPQSVSVTTPFTGNPFGIPDSVAIAACGTSCTPADDFVFTAPVNADGGNLDGFEISYQQAFDNGMGLIANYTYVDSEIDYIDPASPTGISTRDLLGLSGDAYNATVYYEAERFSIRGSASYRDQYLTTIRVFVFHHTGREYFIGARYSLR